MILLHGYSSTSATVEQYFDLLPLARTVGFLYVRPNGTTDSQGNQFWNATDACCDLSGTGVDDSAYLSKLITDLESTYAVDPRRVYVVGHSNGGFMAYRMACDHADQIAAVVSLAGAMAADASTCRPSSPVSVLEVHGTADTIIPYDGGEIFGTAFPGAKESVKDWAALDGCNPRPTSSGPIDVLARPGSGGSAVQTDVLGYSPCHGTTQVRLWTVQGAGHEPSLTQRFGAALVNFLLAHPKP